MRRTAFAALALALTLAPVAARADRDDGHRRGRDKGNPLAPINVAGMGTLSGERIMSGTLTITGFVLDETQSKLMAVGILSAATASHSITNQTVQIPVLNGASLPTAGRIGIQQVTAPGCDVLNLVLGPLHLNLLGLVVDLNQVLLDLTAQPGAGNLLGNLLCSVLGLLDIPGAIAAVVQLVGNLNTLTALLGTL
jgi:hypothetical protein